MGGSRARRSDGYGGVGAAGKGLLLIEPSARSYVSCACSVNLEGGEYDDDFQRALCVRCALHAIFSSKAPILMSDNPLKTAFSATSPILTPPQLKRGACPRSPLYPLLSTSPGSSMDAVQDHQPHVPGHL